MRVDMLEILRCPFCGGRLELVTSLFHQRNGDDLEDGILGCHCCIFPIVSGIPVMHLDDPANTARDHVSAGRPDLARRALFGLDDEWFGRFQQADASPTATYRDVLQALGPAYERGYFLYRFSDPSYVVAHALVRAAGVTALGAGGRAIDLCGGSGHLTRSMLDLSSSAPVLADLYFAKLWLARRFTAPECDAVCCNGNNPLPFARGAFRYAMCADAFMYIWHKRLFVGEMLRIVDDGSGSGTAVISHTHNQLQWSPSLGQPLPPSGYRDLFETVEPRLFAEAGLFADVVRGGPLDLSRRDAEPVLDADPALVIVASRDPALFRTHPVTLAAGTAGELRLNPLYAVEEHGDRVRLRLRFPSADYEDEFGACREYLPESLELERRSLDALAQNRVPPELTELARRRVILDLPKRYY
jgi:uncharacterized protein YbaR (Trm112 family)